MIRLSKTTAVIFSSVLFLISISISIGTENYYLSYAKGNPNSGENINAYKSIGKPDYFLPARHGENLVTSLKILPVFNLTEQTSLNENSSDSGIKKLRANSEYITSSGRISKNLTVSVIVFPSHYFW